MFGKKQPKIDERLLAELAEDVRMCMRKLRDLQEAYDALDDKYTRMRGLIYAKRLHRAPEDTQTNGADPADPAGVLPKQLSRDELRRQLTASGRFMPGKPAVHNEK